MTEGKKRAAKRKAAVAKHKNETGTQPYEPPDHNGLVKPRYNVGGPEHPLSGVPQPHRSENSAHSKSTPEKKAKVLEALREGKTAKMAAREVGVDRSTLFNWKEKDEQFTKDWDEALKEGAEYYEDEVRRRATEGVLEPVFQQGELVGHVRKFSDPLLMMAVKARLPEKYRERSDIKQSGEIKLNISKTDAQL